MFLHYHATHERACYRALNQLLKLRKERSKEEFGFEWQKHEEREQECRQEMHQAKLAAFQAHAQARLEAFQAQAEAKLVARRANRSAEKRARNRNWRTKKPFGASAKCSKAIKMANWSVGGLTIEDVTGTARPQ